MTDVHMHILSGLDDGAKNGTVSAALLQSEWDQGVRTVVFTPHFYGRKRTPEQFFEKRAQALERIRDRIPQGLEVRLGAEVYFKGINTLSDETLCSFAIDGTKCILIELPFERKWSPRILERLESFASETGYTPVLAHVERYRAFVKQPQLLSEFIKRGCLIQVNTGAFVNRRTKKFAFALLKNGYVHCLGTDTHNEETRAPDYASAKEAAIAGGYASEWNTVQDTMRSLLAGETVRARLKKPLKKIFGIYF